MAERSSQRQWLSYFILFWFLYQEIHWTEAFCPVGCLCDDETLQVTCNDVNLTVIPITLNPAVQRLVLRRNKIKSIDVALHFYSELIYVDFSYNQLVAIKNQSFDGLKKLTELRLDYNKISFITNETWIGLSGLAVLTMRDNYIQNLDERAFATAPHIRELDLGKNRIESIHPQAFRGLADLRSLYLDDNRLTLNIPSFPAFLTLLPHLAELSLASNDFLWLPDGLFSALPELSVLDLSGCNIKNITRSAFRGLSQLRTLKLHDNQFGNVPSASWTPLSHLEYMTLGRNNFVKLPAAAFIGLPKLQKLEINGAAQLMTVDSTAFAANRDLTTLRLTNSKKLTALPDNLLTHLPGLSQLDMRDNGLSTIPEKLAPWSQLQLVDFSGNPLHCSCNLVWFRDYLKRRQIPLPTTGPAIISASPRPNSNTTVSQRMKRDLTNHSNPLLLLCSTPITVVNLPLQSLNDDQLGCRSGLKSQSLIIGISCSAAVIFLLLCFLLWRFRRHVRQLCKRPDPKSAAQEIDDSRTLNKWKPASQSWGVNANSVSLIGARTPEYHKTCTSEEECFMRAVTLHNSLKPFPRTEL